MWWLIGAGIFNAFSSYQQGKAMEAQHKQNEMIARHNALLARRDAAAARIELQEEQWLHLFQSEQALGTQQVMAGASGARTDVGAPFAVRAQMSSMLDWERYRLAKKGRKEVEDFMQEAASFGLQARGERAAAKSARQTGVLRAGADILGTVGQGIARNYWLQPKTKTGDLFSQPASFWVRQKA
jgi:hypothetical protein